MIYVYPLFHFSNSNYPASQPVDSQPPPSVARERKFDHAEIANLLLSSPPSYFFYQMIANLFSRGIIHVNQLPSITTIKERDK